MTHLTSEQLVEAAEGILPAERARHLEQCGTCRTNVETLQAVLSDVGDTSIVPEPSPLFWEHFSRRVREATATERVPAPERWWQGCVAAGGRVGCGRRSGGARRAVAQRIDPAARRRGTSASRRVGGRARGLG